MSYCPENKVEQANISTPERKKEYVKRWLEENPLSDADLTINSNELTPDSSFVLQTQDNKQLTLRTPPQSPVCSEKRSASSPIFGGLRKSFKRMKVVPKITELIEQKPSCSKLTPRKNTAEENFNLEKNHKVCFFEKNKILELQEAFNIPVTSANNKFNNLKNNDKQSTESHSSQLIESVSSYNNTENTEFQIEEVDSDTDKTASDLIEDVDSQLICESPQKSKQLSLSQKISNPSSTSSEQTNDHITESSSRNRTDDIHCTEIFTPADQIDSISTLESKGNLSKTSYILEYKVIKPSKKRNPKKGSLSDLLLRTMAKERSSVNLLRHQLYRNPLNIAEMPFILLQILHYLPNFNGNQLFQCVLTEDTANLLKDLVKKKTDSITVMNVPELSSLINVNEKPVLKVYEPWIIVDPNQLLLHITRFIAISGNKEDLNLHNVDNKILKVAQEFYCPCIDNNLISNECDFKFCDSVKCSVKLICNYEP